VKPTNKGEYMVCDICGMIAFLVVDHDHQSGYIRGLLCDGCNYWVARFERTEPCVHINKGFEAWCATYSVASYLAETTEYPYREGAGGNSLGHASLTYRQMRIREAGVPMYPCRMPRKGRYSKAYSQQAMNRINRFLE
jgi:hypothetical protein